MAQDDPKRSEPTDAELALRAIEDGLARIARERARVRAEDWATLFRQLQTLLHELATHHFVKGDIEAELLIERMLRSEDLEQVSARFDDFAEYALRKLEYIQALKAAREGRQDEAPRHVTLQNSASDVTRAEAAGGPSGDDFSVGNKEDASERPRRSLLRL